MMLVETFPLSRDNLTRELERCVHARTGHRVRGLRVEVLSDRIILSGRTASYYVKQLAQHGIWDVVPEATIVNNITVEG
jgi:hypothetical protein